MSSHGKTETKQLQQNLEEQLDRLVQQLDDIEQFRDEMDITEYEESKAETMEQLREFNESLNRLISGDTTLIDHFGAMQLATQAAISEAFKTPAVIRMFRKREPASLRNRLEEIGRDVKLGKLSQKAGNHQRGEILNALRQLGEKLTASELQLLEKLSANNIDTADFVHISENTERGQVALDLVGKEVKTTHLT